MALMLLWMNDFRTVFWVATLPAFIALLLLVFAVQEKNRGPHMSLENPLAFKNIRYLDKRYASVVVMGVLLGFARFSEVFLVLRAFDSGIAMALVPLVMVLMNVVYAASAYPLGHAL